ncbi:MAG: tetratricopeptide repeat protein [Magnetococcus sp. WYHC-3]
MDTKKAESPEVIEKIDTVLKDIEGKLTEINVLNEATIESILAPVRTLKDNTEDLSKLEVVQAQLERQIIEPFRSIHRESDRRTTIFNWFGVIFGISGLILSIVSWIIGDNSTRKVNDSVTQISNLSTAMSNTVEQLEKKTDSLLAITNAMKEDISSGGVNGADNLTGVSDNPELNEAAAMLEAVETLGGNSGNSSYMLALLKAKSALDNADYETARKLAEKARRLARGESDKSITAAIEIVTAQSYYKERNYPEALKHFTKAIEADPENSSSYNNRGSVYFAMAKDENDSGKKNEMQEKAIADQRKSLELEQDPVVVVNLSTALNAAGRYQEAFAAMEGYTGEDNGLVSYQKAATLALLGRADEAIALLEKAIEKKNGVAVMALADDDFASLRSDNRFLTALKANRVITDDILERAKRVWSGQK